jgi:hypothetical protein
VTEGCDNYPDWQGCECELDGGHDGPHECVCGAQWDDDGRMLRRGYGAGDPGERPRNAPDQEVIG